MAPEAKIATTAKSTQEHKHDIEMYHHTRAVSPQETKTSLRVNNSDNNTLQAPHRRGVHK